MIEITNLCKSFGSLSVLKDFCLTIQEGEVISLIGPSGTGKSTLLRCMNYLEHPEKGILNFDGQIYNAESISKREIHQLRQNSSMVFQNYNLFAHKTAAENIMEHLIHVKKMNRTDAREKALELLRKVNLEDKANEYPRKLSGGQQQRVGIARAMAVEPKIILFDEPTSSLDPELVSEVLNAIRDLAVHHQTMLIVTHEMQFARNVSDRILFLDGGNIVEDGPPDEIFENPKSQRLQLFFKNINHN